MDRSAIAWFEQLFETHSANVTTLVREEIAAVHKRLDVAHDKLNTALVAVSHLIRRDANMPDHAQILADLKAFDAELDSKVDAAVAEFESFVATHTAVKDSLDDIAEIVAGLPAKAAKLDAIKEPTDASTSTQQSASGTETSAPVTSTTTTSSGVSVTTTVDQSAGTTTAVSTDPTTGASTTTTVQHADGSASTTDTSGTPVATDQEAVQAATSAAQAAGVSVGSTS